MSANADLEDVASSSKDDESNTVPDATTGSSCKASGDTDDSTTVKQPSLTHETGVPELQSLEQSSIDKPIEVTTDETVKLGAGDLGSLIDTKATLEISNNKEISLKDTDILKDHFMENLKPLTSTSYSESIDNNGTNHKNIAKSTTEIAGYKETAIDDASDSDLELHWTDDDDDEDDQIDAHTSCDQALKQLDRELNIVDVETDTNEVEGEKSTAQDSETMDNIPTAVEKKHEYLESGRVKIDSNIQSLDKQLLKPFDNVQGIDDDKKLVDKSIDTAVSELQQLIDGDDNMLTEKTQSKCSEEESKPVVCGSATVSISTNNFVSLDVDEPTDIDVSPTSSHTNDIYLDIGVKEHDVIATAVADITDPITMSNCVDDNTVSNEVDEGMNSNDNKETTLNIQTKMDDIASKNVITSIGVKDHIDRNDGKKNAVIVEIISKDNILNESNDHKIDDSNTEIKINNDGANAMDKGIADRQISDIDAKDSLKCLTVNISDGKVSTECVDESMDSNDVAELVPEFRKNDAEIKDKDSNNIMTECENMISNTDTSKSLKENVDKSIHNTEFISPKTQKIEITNKDDGKVLTKCDGRVIVSDDIAETVALETAVKDSEGKTKHDRETLQGFVDQEMEDNDSTRTVNSKMQASEVNVIGADDDKISKDSDQTLNDSDNKETALKMQTDNEAVTNVTNIEILKESDGQIMHGNDNTDLVSNMQISKVNILNADSNILNKSNNQNVDDNDKAGLKIQNTSNAVDKKTFHKSDSQIVCDHDANADIIGSKVQSDEIDVACVAEDNISSETENHAVEVSGNTEMVLKLETDKVDRTSATSGKTINKSNDQSLNVDTDIDIGSKIQSYKVDTACVAEDNISREAEVHAVDASNSIKTVSIIDKDDLSSMTDDKASKESIEINKAESNTDKFDIQIADIKMSEGQAMDGEDKTKRDSKIQFGKVDVASKFASIIEMQEVDARKNVDSVKNVETTDVIPVKADEFITPDTTSDSIKINKDHRITRPDVMLDIPTQEFDFDDEYNDTNEKEAPLERMNEDASDMTSKTVTEIVNQLAKDMSPEKEVLNKNAGKLDVSIDATEVKLDSEINAEKQEVLEKVLIKNTAVKKTSSVELANKVIAKEKNNADNETAKTEEKDLKPTELYTKAVEVGDSKPSTSEVAKMTPDTLEEAQDVTDSLLAESSRVLDDDEEEDEPEPDDDGEDGDDGDDDDDDFRPEDDNSNQTEESNSRHSEMDIQEEGIDIVFGNEADGIGLVSDSNDAEDAFNAALLGDTADITVEENDPVLIVPTTSVPEAKDDQQKAEPEIVDSEKEEQPIATAGKKTTTERRKSLLKDLLSRQNDEEEPPSTLSTIKLKKLDISCASNIVNIVDLEESSSEDDKESKQNAPSAITTDKPDQGTVDMLKSVALKRPSTDCESVAPSSKDKVIDKDKAKDGEVFNLDSDDDSSEGIKDTGKPRENNQCINHNCVSMSSVPYYLADRVTVAYYGAARKRRRAVCQNCLDIVRSRNEGLLAGIKDFRPLMSLRMARPTQQLLEISDSDSEGEDDPVGEEGAKIIEEQLADLLNQSWYKYKLDDRLKETEEYLEAELEKMQKQSEEIDVLLKDCQKATDRLRVEFYSGFEPRIMELPAISLHDTPIASYTCLESEEDFSESSQLPMRYPKRRSSTAIETPAKKQAIPMGYTDMEIKTATRSSREASETNQEEDKDISVVRLSAESAPADLPPPGELVRPPLRAGQQVYAMKNQYGAWLKGKVLETLAKTSEHQYTQCRIRFDHKVKNPCKTLSARSIAYTEPSEVRMTIGTRVIALFKNSENTNKRVSFYYSGVIAEIPNPVNSYRYLVFFDDGYAQYVPHMHTRLVCESSALVWEEVHPFSRDFVCNYLMKYPERPMVRMHQGQSLTVEWNGKWWDTKVIEVDAALVKVNFPDNRTEWIYRGSTRLQPLFAELQAARGGNRARLPRSTKANTKTNMPYVEYTRSEDQTNKVEGVQSSEELRKQRSVAKKSTTASTLTAFAAADGVVSRVVFYTPKNSVRPYKMVPHTCGPHCNRKDLLSLKELRTYNPLTKPLLSGWERQIVRHKYNRTVMYRAPCGRRVRSVRELHRYLRAVRSDMAVDLFDFSANTHCLAEFVLNKTNVQKKDLSHGKENVPVPCVNYYDHSLPEFCSYNTERTPTAGVPLNLDPEFLCGCDCEDDCVDKRKCACWKMTLEGARTIGIEGTNVGYEYRRLPEPLPSGIYECNSRCKCKATCMNRVVQNPLQLKLQVFKTLNRGWGIRALNDVPKGAFLCIYAGNLLTDATANLDGLNEGDEYLAELDYIEVVESMKEGYEEDIPEADKILDKKDSKKSESELESESTDSGDEEKPGKSDEMDDDFQPGYLSQGIGTFNKRLRRRDKKKNKEEAKVKAEDQPNEEKKKEEGGECITISDDEEVRESQREPSRFTAQEGMSDSKVVSKYRSIRTYFGKDEACYIMDAKVQGNIGRYLNHSCSPNVFVQNVFVDTHDPRFPWVSFFALHHIRAGTELTWNYNYDIGSVPGKVLYCFCGAPNCRGRLL